MKHLAMVLAVVGFVGSLVAIGLSVSCSSSQRAAEVQDIQCGLADVGKVIDILEAPRLDGAEDHQPAGEGQVVACVMKTQQPALAMRAKAKLEAPARDAGAHD